MQTIPIPVQPLQWLSDALLHSQGNRNIPTNVILKKTLPGLGATYGEINTRISPRNSISESMYPTYLTPNSDYAATFHISLTKTCQCQGNTYPNVR